MKKTMLWALTSAIVLASCGEKTQPEPQTADANQFVRVQGPDLIQPNGEKLFIVGTNLGNWLNPEGYMFGFQKCNSGHWINEMFCQLVGPDATAEFWAKFKDQYITRKDIEFIAKTGANTIRMPFNYKLFTDEDFMGLTSQQDGFARMDSTVAWCRDNGLYLILDMHDCPGGQTGDNIDDSYGYPWLFESETSQQLYCSIWKQIADRYKNEPVILGYELMNEPIPHYMDNLEERDAKVEPLYKRVTASIREVDKNHIILLGGPQWNSYFGNFTDWTFDDKLMYTCHRYGGESTAEAIKSYIDFRDKTQLPMYMGEIGHNTMEWQKSFSQVMRDNNIGYTFWPYKKMGDSCMNGWVKPEGWQKIIDFSEAQRDTYAALQAVRPNRDEALKLMNDMLEAIKFENCQVHAPYIESMLLNVPE